MPVLSFTSLHPKQQSPQQRCRNARRPVASAVALLLLAMLAACTESDKTARRADSSATLNASSANGARSLAPADTDDFGAPLPLDASASARIVSLNPTATELLYAIGASDRLVGRSAWDEFPAEVKSVHSVGDGIRPNIEAVLGVKPTLVLLYATAENRAAATALLQAVVRVMALRIEHIADFMRFTSILGRAVGCPVPRGNRAGISCNASLQPVARPDREP